MPPLGSSLPSSLLRILAKASYAGCISLSRRVARTLPPIALAHSSSTQGFSPLYAIIFCPISLIASRSAFLRLFCLRLFCLRLFCLRLFCLRLFCLCSLASSALANRLLGRLLFLDLLSLSGLGERFSRSANVYPQWGTLRCLSRNAQHVLYNSRQGAAKFHTERVNPFLVHDKFSVSCLRDRSCDHIYNYR
nr:MAG TPA: hypothetical protein [Caudoviricetes sp.]